MRSKLQSGPDGNRLRVWMRKPRAKERKEEKEKAGKVKERIRVAERGRPESASSSSRKGHVQEEPTVSTPMTFPVDQLLRRISDHHHHKTNNKPAQ